METEKGTQHSKKTQFRIINAKLFTIEPHVWNKNSLGNQADIKHVT